MELMGVPSLSCRMLLETVLHGQSKFVSLVFGRPLSWDGFRVNRMHLKQDMVQLPLRTEPRALYVCLALSSAAPASGSRRDQLDYFTYGSGSDDDGEEGEIDSHVQSRNVEEDTLLMLEWPAVCLQVAEFASTSMGISVASSAKVAIGRSQQESQVLLNQTKSAISLSSPLDFSGIEDVRDIVSDALSGNASRCQDLCRIKGTLSATRRLCDKLDLECGLQPEALIPLQAIMAGVDLCTDLEKDIELCIDCCFFTVLDQASSSLATARRNRQQNMKSLESKLKDTASKIVDAGGIDMALVTKRRARLCVAVRASHKSLLPGGIVLDVSNTGATLFVEPECAVILNNAEIQLAAVEEAEVNAVLQRLTLELIDNAENILDLLERVIILDLAYARAAHARWLQAVEPIFGSLVRPVTPMSEGRKAHGESQSESSKFMIEMLGVRHPLLLGASLPRPLASQRRLRQKPSVESVYAGKALVGAEGAINKTDMVFPVPIDIFVKVGVKVVTITGPNTGGKTAALKTLGVTALMAKAGLFLPAAGRPTLPWFGAVLADVGDDQSLQRSLSTFSGHVQRICSILDFGGKDALVLLDEVGGGTDPSEGASLATSVLRNLASSVSLTLATTHSAELRTLKNKDSRFENASVEFNIKTLSPTYRVLWGVAGQSNALNIAASLKFDAAVIERARYLVKKLAPCKIGVRASEVMVPLAKQLDEQRQLSKAAEDALAKDRQFYNELLSKLKDTAEQESALKLSEVTAINNKIREGKTRMEGVVLRYQESFKGSVSENALSMREAQSAIAEIAAELDTDFDSYGVVERPNDSVETNQKVPPVGAKVFVRRLGKVPATVVESSPGSSSITVQLGSMKLSVQTSDVSYGAGGVPTRPSATPKHLKPMRRQDTRVLADQGAGKDDVPLKFEVAVQTSRNTLDLRGMRVDDAERELNLALGSRAPSSLLFVVHGIGTGAVKEAVWRILKTHPYVAKFEEESTQNAGCTIVYIK